MTFQDWWEKNHADRNVPGADRTFAEEVRNAATEHEQAALKNIQTEVEDWNSGKTMFADLRPGDNPRAWDWSNLIDRIGRIASTGIGCVN